MVSHVLCLSRQSSVQSPPEAKTEPWLTQRRQLPIADSSDPLILVEAVIVSPLPGQQVSYCKTHPWVESLCVSCLFLFCSFRVCTHTHGNVALCLQPLPPSTGHEAALG